MPKPGRPHSGKWIAYYRVSTDRQGDSGLGLHAQRKLVSDYLNGGNWVLSAEFTEVESGKRSDRPQLAAALAMSKKLRAKLIVAKLDRLSRNVGFISTLMDSGVEFVAADMPHANKMTLQVLAVFAEYERDLISDRTRRALGQAKERGVQLGGPKRLQALRPTRPPLIASLQTSFRSSERYRRVASRHCAVLLGLSMHAASQAREAHPGRKLLSATFSSGRRTLRYRQKQSEGWVFEQRTTRPSA